MHRFLAPMASGDPFSDFGSWPLESLFDRFMDTGRSGAYENVTQAFSPRLDMEESADGIRLSMELAGMDEKDIEISASSGGYITIKGEKKPEKPGAAKTMKHVSERYYGAFSRTLCLPEDVDVDKITAKFERGLLKIDLPKTEAGKEKVRKIVIK